MGMFDTFNVDDCDGQVKMFEDTLDTFNMGDFVDKRCGTFSIRLRGGLWVNIKSGYWESYTPKPETCTHFNKWGGDWDYDNPPYK